jgi:sigma-B regulation protein RsbU (phosphoserine phosphatase)
MFEGAEYDTQAFELRPDERLVMYSDGITDCFDADGRAFDVDHLRATLLGARGGSAQDMASALEQAVSSWRGHAELEDDVSVLIIHRP